jgi:hypothetical protein
MPTIRDLQSTLRKYKFSDVEVVHLAREKPRDNRSKVRAFAARVEKEVTGFQDSDFVLVALKVDHRS